MTKVTIELNLTTVERIAAVFAIARLLEFDEAHGDLELDEYGYLNDYYLWCRSLPNALAFVMESLERTIARGERDEILARVFDGQDWDNAIGWLKQQAAELDELNASVHGASDDGEAAP